MGKRSREKERHKKEKKRARSDSGSPPSPHRLVLDAALGDRRSCKALLKAGVDVGYADAEGTTALHEACRHGHLDVVKLLLKRGAPTDAPDVRGDTPAHLAARHRHLDVVAALLQSRHPPDIEARNRQGASVRQLVAAAMGPEAPRQRGSAAGGDWERAQARATAEQAQQAQHGAQSEEDSWRQRLAEELSDGEGGSAWGESESAYARAEEYETAEEYAQRIWEEMQARRQAQRDAAMAAFRRRRREEDSRRAWARQQAEEASQKVLEEERAKDAAWRQAVAQGQAGAKRANYEAKWQFFASKPHEGPITYEEVPWILPEGAGAEELQHVVLYGAATPEEKKRRLRAELVRWHPDKFTARFGGRLAEGDRGRVLERVNATSQQLNALSAALPR